MAKPTAKDINERFFVPTTNPVVVTLCTMYRDMAMSLCEICPDGRPLSVALTELETSFLWALRAIQ